MKTLCKECRYFEPIRVEDSGLKSGWKYWVGRCHAEGTIHPHPPAWNSCHLAKQKRKKKVTF
jgi:hypothetical protein